MTDTARFYIDGRWVAPLSNATKDIINPATEDVIGRVALGSSEDVDCAVRAARAAWEGYRDWSREQRIALFDRIIEAYKARHVDLARAATVEIGSPHWFSDDYQAGMALAHFQEDRRMLEYYPF